MKVRIELAGRIREIREDLYGVDGIDALAGTVGVPAYTWCNYEGGVTMPAWVLLRFLALTGANPNWLLTGEGERLGPDIQPFLLETTSHSDLVENL